MFDDLNNQNSGGEENKNDPINGSNFKPVIGNNGENKTTTNISTPPITAPPNTSKAPRDGVVQVEDIFSGSDDKIDIKNEKPAVFQPKEAAAIGESEEVRTKSSSWQKIVIPVVLIIGLLLLGVGGVYGYRAIIKYLGDGEQDTDVTADKTPVIDESVPDLVPDVAIPDEPQTGPMASPPLDTGVAAKDSDGDGLTDAEEAALGTNAENVDTDNDGLFDREEVKVYNSDPLNPDTDGDGYRDGDEVKAQYNPVGEGKLYEIFED